MEPYHIKHQHQQSANHSEHSFAHCPTPDTNTQHPHNKTKVLLMGIYLKPQATQLTQLTQTQKHSLHYLNAHSDPSKNIKAKIFYNNECTNIIILDPDRTTEECKEKLKHIYTTITSQYSVPEKITKSLTTHPMTSFFKTSINFSHMIKAGTVQNQQITTLAQLPTHSKP